MQDNTVQIRRKCPPTDVLTGFTPCPCEPIAPVFAGSRRTGVNPVPTRFFLFEQYCHAGYEKGTSDNDVGFLSPISGERDGVAIEGIWIGMGMSIIAMLFAAFGFITPAAGALLQEGIDVIVILNALRVGRISF